VTDAFFVLPEYYADSRGVSRDRLIQVDWRTSEEDGQLVGVSPESRPHPAPSAVNLVMMRFEMGVARDSKHMRSYVGHSYR
jgi:hypothetical protein